jgi:hypothetical protein
MRIEFPVFSRAAHIARTICPKNTNDRHFPNSRKSEIAKNPCWIPLGFPEMNVESHPTRTTPQDTREALGRKKGPKRPTSPRGYMNLSQVRVAGCLENLLRMAKRKPGQHRQEPPCRTCTRSLLTNVITFDDHRIKNHFDHVVLGSVEKTLNALLDAKADRAMPSATSAAKARRDTRRDRDQFASSYSNSATSWR